MVHSSFNPPLSENLPRLIYVLSRRASQSNEEEQADLVIDPRRQLALPWYDTPHTSSVNDPTSVTSNIDSIRLECLGPMVINLDGTISRITNWSDMTEIERTNVLRIITNRNRERRLAIMKAQRSQLNSDHAPDR